MLTQETNSTMNRLLSTLAAFTAVATASVANCGSSWYVQQFTVDPPATVGSGQNVSMTAVFDIPEGMPPIESGIITLHGVASFLFDMEVQHPMCQYLPCPLTAGTYTWSWKEPFPEGLIGRVLMNFQLDSYPQRQQKPWLCLQWAVYATGRTTNETNSAIRWLYS